MYVWLNPGWDLARVRSLYEETYAGEPFVHVLPDGKLATIAHVANTNRCVVSFSAVRRAS